VRAIRDCRTQLPAPRSFRCTVSIYACRKLPGSVHTAQLADRRAGGHMTSKVGVWIDHRRAVIVVVGPAEEHIAHIVSNVEKHPERSGDSPMKGSYESRQVPPDDRRQMALTGELNNYYDAVIAAVRDAESLLIFGPGEAKGEFKKRLDNKKLSGRVAAVETADKMTDAQIAAKVRRYFASPG
jgi:hypothetical protein